MSRTRRRLASRTLAVLLAAGALALPATAHAERWTGTDARHDVRSLNPDAADCRSLDPRPAPRNRTADLTRLTVEHGADAVRLSAHVRDVRARNDLEVLMFVRTPARSYLVATYRFTPALWPHQQTAAAVGRVPRGFRHPCAHQGQDSSGSTDSSTGGSTASGRRGTQHTCEELPARYLLRKDVVTTTVPRRCLGTPTWVRVGVAAIDTSGKRAVLDTWSPDGDPAGLALVGGLSPRVHAGARPLRGVAS